MRAVLEQHLGGLQVTVLHRERQRGAQEAAVVPRVHARRVFGEVQQELYVYRIIKINTRFIEERVISSTQL